MNTILVAVATAELLLNSADEKRKSTGGVGRTGHFLVFTDTNGFGVIGMLLSSIE